jgi:hypothetical protein
MAKIADFLYTIFNVMKRILKATLLVLLILPLLDLVLFYTVGITIDPIDQWAFVLMVHAPKDFYVPEVSVPIEEGKKVYEFEYTHRYSGRHEVLLNIVRDQRTGEDFFQFSGDGVEIEVEVSHPFMRTIKQKWKCNKRIYYDGDEMGLPLFRYENKWAVIDKCCYKVKLTVKGPMDELLKKHPKSYWSVKNDTHK